MTGSKGVNQMAKKAGGSSFEKGGARFSEIFVSYNVRMTLNVSTFPGDCS